MAKNRSDPGGDDPGSERGGRPRKRARSDESLVPEIIRRAMAMGLSGFFTTEEAFRRALGDTVPRDWVDFAATQSERTRADFTDRLAQELGKVIAEMDPVEVIEQLLEGRTIEIRASVKLGTREPGAARRGRARSDTPSSLSVAVREVDEDEG